MIIDAPELAGRLSRRDVVLIDVRLADDFAAGHIPGALSQCVFEVVFLPELEAKGIHRDLAICVYGAAHDSHESAMAAEKLERAGFKQVLDFAGGLEAWVAAGHPIESQSPSPTAPAVPDGVRPFDLAESRVLWVGRNLVNKHWGHVAIASGEVEFRDGLPRRGSATLDMRRITCSDLAGDALHDVLIHHLESDDFFDVARFPEARFSFDRAEQCKRAPGCRNLRLHGQLTLRGVTKPLLIEAAAGVTPEGKAALQSTFTVNRTDWGVLYGSGSFFRRLGGHLVNDDIELQLRILAP